MLDGLRYERFHETLADQYRVDAPDEGPDLVLRLTDVRRLGPAVGAPRPDPFALLFSGPREPALGQGTHHLRHPDLGELDIFLVPVGRAPDGGVLYEAIFN